MLSWLAIIVVLLGDKTDPPPVAWSTLIGAVVGGALSILGTLLVERQRGKAATRQADRHRQMEGRLAARLIVAELEDARSVLRVVIEREPYAWPPSNGFQFEGRAWAAHGGALAAAVPDKQWELVAGPYFSYRYANLLEQVHKNTAETMLSATEDAISALNEWIESVAESS
jgi:hypothetical protein